MSKGGDNTVYLGSCCFLPDLSDREREAGRFCRLWFEAVGGGGVESSLGRTFLRSGNCGGEGVGGQQADVWAWIWW